MKKVLSYVLPVLLGFLVAFISERFQMEAIQNWYPLLHKSSLTPPNWIFPVMWGIIYIMSGISFGMIWNTRHTRRKELIVLWNIQLVLNLAWSILFFYFRSPLSGMIDILALDIIVIWYIIRSFKVSKTASMLFYIYGAWLVLATYLNGYILVNN